ncbi:hypothetical protein ABKN59_011503 [Abortiporus biennis]
MQYSPFGISPKQVIALVTDNPMVMHCFWQLFVQQPKYSHILDVACFLHRVNTLIGHVCDHPVIKKVISQNAKIVTFFNRSHYWGDQLQQCAEKYHLSHSLKTHTNTRWYSLILQAMTIRDYKTVLQEVCWHPDAQEKTNRFSPVSLDVVNIICCNPSHFTLNLQLI